MVSATRTPNSSTPDSLSFPRGGGASTKGPDPTPSFGQRTFYSAAPFTCVPPDLHTKRTLRSPHLSTEPLTSWDSYHRPSFYPARPAGVTPLRSYVPPRSR